MGAFRARMREALRAYGGGGQGGGGGGGGGEGGGTCPRGVRGI